MKKILLLLFTCIMCSLNTNAADSNQKPVKVLWYNINNYLADIDPHKRKKSEESKTAVEQIIASINADIVMLSEIGGESALKELTDALKKRDCHYTFSSVVETDGNIALGMLSKIKPSDISHSTSHSYTNKGKKYKVLRGFAHCEFTFDNGYNFHIFSAHLKSRYGGENATASQRQSEARCLRQFYKEVFNTSDIQNENFIIMGDMNDDQDTKTIKLICDRDIKKNDIIYDTRPVDSSGLSWTIYWGRKDLYSRFDYMFASKGIIPEVDWSRTKIPDAKDWRLSSDHRPLVITIYPEDKKLTNIDLNKFNKYGTRTNQRNK